MVRAGIQVSLSNGGLAGVTQADLLLHTQLGQQKTSLTQAGLARLRSACYRPQFYLLKSFLARC